jgi:iron(III) transport system permease protein
MVTMGILLGIPLFSIAINLFGGVGDMWSHILEYFLFEYISNSAYLLAGTGVICSLLGVSTAWIINKYEFKYRKLISWLLYMPLAIPSYIVAYTYVGLFGNGGSLILILQKLGFGIQKIEFMNTLGLIWVLSISLYPYVYGSLRAMFSNYPHTLRDAAYLLGANENKYFFKIALPMASPALIASLFLVFMEVLNDYGAAKYYGINTFTTGIFRTWTALEDLSSAIYLSAILLVLVFALMRLNRWMRSRRSYAFKIKANTTQESRRVKLEGKRKYVVYSILSIPILFGLVFPLGQLIHWASLNMEALYSSELWEVAFQSVSLASVSAVLILLFALMLLYLSKWNYIKSLNFFSRIPAIGYVLPGAIIGIGIIRSSQGIINFFQNQFDLQMGYLFYGSSFVLIYAYIFRFMAVAYNPIEASSLKLGKGLSESSYLLGANRWKTIFKIDFPLLKPVILSTFLLVFIDLMKELPLTLILKPYDLNTLALNAYAYADDERLVEAAWPALLLVAMIGVLMVILNRRTKVNSN